MRNVIFTVIATGICFAMTNCVFCQELAAVAYPAHASTFADYSSNAPAMALWQWKMFRLFPANCEDFNNAVTEAKLKLKPGESKKFAVYFFVMQDGQPIRFMYLHPADQDVLRPANIQCVAEIELTRENYGVIRFPVLAENEFKNEKIFHKYYRDYNDYNFCMNAINAMNGFSERDVTNFTVHDIDEKARAAAGGTVILISREEGDVYQVFDPAAKTIDPKSYEKKDTIKEMGNTVWLYVKRNDGFEYTIVYSHLDKINVKLGQSLTQTQEVGSWKSTETTNCRWYIYRIFGAKTAFLREFDNQKPYCVFPNN